MALEMATMEGLMKVPQDSVPCKIRAKRGCATHPRSIAERVSIFLIIIIIILLLLLFPYFFMCKINTCAN